MIAAKAVCFGEALKPEFKGYIEKTVENARALSIFLTKKGIDVLTQGTDNHLLLLDLRNTRIDGAMLEERLESIGIVTNKNAIPFDTASKTSPSGLRIGTPAVTSRGLGIKEMEIIAQLISNCINTSFYEEYKEDMQKQVLEICAQYPLYKD